MPSWKESYFEELELSQWGLFPVAQLDTYKGLIFATFDAEAHDHALEHMEKILGVSVLQAQEA